MSKVVNAYRCPGGAELVIACDDYKAVSAKRGRARADHVSGDAEASREFTCSPRPVLREHEREDRRFNTPPLSGQQVSTLNLHGR